MEANKIKGPAKSLILPNGVEITYAEYGENNSEVLITGALYHHTFMPVVKGMAKRYHVYAVVMRFDGPTSQLNEDGTTHWAKQWGQDVYDFAQALGIKRFHYMGKCHGTLPGWWLFKNHPEVMIDFASFFLGPHTMPANSNEWMGLIASKKIMLMMKKAMRKPLTGLIKKMMEMRTIGANATSDAVSKYIAYPELIWDNDIPAIEKALRNAPMPVGYMFGSLDPLFHDYYDANMRLKELTKGCRFVIVEGEKHLMELDCPDRVVQEVFDFIDSAH